jgi:Family of unknown function (DUF6508)
MSTHSRDQVDPLLRPLTPAQIDAILVHLPHLESVARGDFEPGSAGINVPTTVQSDRTYAFFQDLYDLEIIQPFDWMRWNIGEELTESQDQLAVASLALIHKLIIGHVRLDRFSDGHFDDMVENGFFARALRRLQALRAEL